MRTIYYRGLSKDYSQKGSADEIFADNFMPSFFRNRQFDLAAEKKHYRDMLAYIRMFNIQLKSDIPLNNASPKYALKILGYIQHYGLESRLLDVSSDKEVAEYFACCGNFHDEGYVVTFDNENIIPRSPNALVTVHYKLRDFLDEKITSSQVQFKNKHIIVDYTKLFNTKSTNCRYEKQSGGFILFCSDQTSINYRLVEGTDYYKEVIPADHKIRTLLDVSAHGKNYVELFPDSESSMELYSLYNGFDSGTLSLRDVARKVFRDNKVPEIDRFEDCLKLKHIFYLFFKEFIPILRSKKEDVEQLEKAMRLSMENSRKE